MKTTAKVNFACSSVEAARGLHRVLTPDNEGAPRGLSLSQSIRGAQVEFDLSSESPATAVSTALGILRDVSLFQEIWLLTHVGEPDPKGR